MPINHSPIKLAPIFTSGTHQGAKRKNDDGDASLDENFQTDPKRVCADETPSSDISNAMILQAITALTSKIDGMETKIIATVDAKLVATEDKLTTMVTEAEKRYVDRLIQLENEVNQNLNKLDTELDDRLQEMEYCRPAADQESRIDQLERLARANELIISGVPHTEQESLDAICNDIYKAIGFNGPNSVETYFRLYGKKNVAETNQNTNRQGFPPILIKFWSSCAKNEFFQLYMDKGNLCVTDIGFTTPSRIYVNENLTRKNFEICRLARKLKMDRKIFQYHTYNGRISVKLNADSKKVAIDSEEHLYSLIEDAAAQHHQQRNRSSNHQTNQQSPQQQIQQPKQQPNQSVQPNHPNQQSTQANNRNGNRTKQRHNRNTKYSRK